MLTRLTKGLRARAAVFLAVFYALCTFAPAMAITIVPGMAAHCLTEGHLHGSQAPPHTHGSESAHVHDGGTQHEHGQVSGDDHRNAAQCCGIACISALPANVVGFAGRPLIRIIAPLVVEHEIAGLTPDLLYRPPISFLSR